VKHVQISETHSPPSSAVYLLGPLFSPLEFPVTAQNFNFSSVIFVFVTLCGAVSWWVVPEDMWLSRRALKRIEDSAAGPGSAEGETHKI
jgi:hypothetical protein